MCEKGGFRSTDGGDSGSSRTARTLKMKAVFCFETSGINTPAATLHWIYFYSDKRRSEHRFFQSRQKISAYLKQRRNILCAIFMCAPCISDKHFIIQLIIILPVVLYGCETWSLTFREEMMLRVFENMVLRRIFGPRRDEVTGEWRRLYNEELNNLYSSHNIVRVIKSRRMR